MRWLWIFLGGGLGSLCRVALGGLVATRIGTGLPWGTFAVNALGCFVIGAIAAWLDTRSAVHPSHPFLVAGFLGGFTTFSTFGLETLRLFEAARTGTAALYATGSVLVGVAAVATGVALFRAVHSA